jgi:superfamily I DNA/RNA helicase
MQWMVPGTYLGQEQKFIIDQCVKSSEECEWIQGFAGSGKTVLLVLAMERIKLENPNISLCFVTYTHALKDMVGSGLSEKTKSIPIQTVDNFVREGKRFNVVFVDEIQDIEEWKLKKLKSLCDRLIIAGDVDQSIYDNGVSEADIRGLLNPTTSKLTVLYRLTPSLQAIARAILPNTEIAGAKIQKGGDTDVVLAKADSDESEAAWVIKKADLLSKPGRPSVVILPKSDAIFNFVENVAIAKGVPRPKKVYTEGKYNKIDWNVINDYLRTKGIGLRYLGSGFGDLLESDKTSITYIMTYHSSKGLDFGQVFLPQMNDDISLWRNDEEMEKRLFFVGVTRCREHLFISYSTDEPHDLVGGLPSKNIKQISCEQDLNPKSPENGSDEIYF